MTKEYVRSCAVCQQAKYSTQSPAGLLQPLLIPSHIWQDISMDFITGLPLAHGCSVILVVVDRLSKFAHFIPLPADFTAPKVAEAFLKNVISVHGIPQSIVSDRDKVFTSKFWEQCCGKQGIMLARSSAYHPETNVKLRSLIDVWKCTYDALLKKIHETGTSYCHGQLIAIILLFIQQLG